MTLTEARAATITTTQITLPQFSTGSFGPFGVTPAPNNDEAAGPNPNNIGISLFFNSFGVADFEFITANSGGTTEYQFPSTLVNNSRQDWSNVRFELGFGSGANFVRSSALDLLDFDVPGAGPTSSRFGTVAADTDTIDWTNGAMPWISGGQFAFAIDVPDSLAAINPYGLDRFTLRLSPNGVTAPPAVPEPTSMLLLGSGLLGLAAKARGRRRARGHDA